MSEIRPLTSIRGIAAISVLLFHLKQELPVLVPQLDAVLPIFRWGHIGVDLFFMLSGFILSLVYQRDWRWSRHGYVRFLMKRMARIYPVHLFTLLVMALLVLLAHSANIKTGGNYSASSFFYNLFLLQAFPGGYMSWNHPSWSISVEFFAYLIVFPPSLLLFRNRSSGPALVVTSFILLLPYLYVRELLGTGAWEPFSRIFFEFLSGAALYTGLRDRPDLARIFSRILPVIPLLVLAALLVPQHPLPAWQIRSLIILSCPVVIGGLFANQGFICRLMNRPWPRYLGVISYSLYMCQALVEKSFKVLLPVSSFAESSLGVRWLLVAIHLLAPVFCAALLYHLIEEPARRLIQRLAK